MRIHRLEIEDFRNYRQARLTLPAGLVLIVGPNGTGKTNLMEAVGLAATGRSPRGAADGDLIRHGAGRCRVRVEARHRRGAIEVEAVIAAPGTKRLLLNGRPVRRRSDLLGHLPLVTFFPDDLALVKGTPSLRRRFLDLLISQCRPRHAAEVQQYASVLRQRNSLLGDIRRGSASKELADLFDEQLVRAGVSIIVRRLHFVKELEKVGAPIQEAVGEEKLGLAYSLAGREPRTLETVDLPAEDQLAGWAQEQIEHLRQEEIRRGYTLWGPHRDDLVIRLDGRDARMYASQGQQRTVVLALKMSEIRLLTGMHGETPLVILDDVLSELDQRRTDALLHHLAQVEQVFLTATRQPDGVAAGAAVLAVAGGQVLQGINGTGSNH